MTYLVLAVILVLFVMAWRAFQRFHREQSAQAEALRHAAVQQGWQFEAKPVRGVELRISGTSAGIHWTVQQDDGVGEDGVSSVTWATTAVDAQPIILYVAAAQSVQGMRGALGDLVLRMAEEALTKKGLPAHLLGDFFTHAEDYAFASPHLNARYGVLTTSRNLARHILSPDVEKALQDWPGMTPILQIGDRNVRIYWAVSSLDAEALHRLVDLGMQLAQRQGHIGYCPASTVGFWIR